MCQLKWVKGCLENCQNIIFWCVGEGVSRRDWAFESVDLSNEESPSPAWAGIIQSVYGQNRTLVRMYYSCFDFFQPFKHTNTICSFQAIQKHAARLDLVGRPSFAYPNLYLWQGFSILDLLNFFAS